MKTKRLNKKLLFKKETISNLEKTQMVDIRGGATILSCNKTCVTDCVTFCVETKCALTCRCQ